MVEETSFKGNWCCFGKGSETQNFGFINWVNLALPQKSRRLLLPSSLSALRPYDGTTSIRNMNFQFRLFITFYDVDKRNFVVVSDSMENAWDKHGDKKIRPRSAEGGNKKINALSCLVPERSWSVLWLVLSFRFLDRERSSFSPQSQVRGAKK